MSVRLDTECRNDAQEEIDRHGISHYMKRLPLGQSKRLINLCYTCHGRLHLPAGIEYLICVNESLTRSQRPPFFAVSLKLYR